MCTFVAYPRATTNATCSLQDTVQSSGTLVPVAVLQRIERARSLRILHVINQASAQGGAERSLEDILLKTDPAEFSHGLVVLRVEALKYQELVPRGLPVFVPTSHRRSTWAKIQHVRSAIRTFEPDLVHTTLFEAGFVGRIAARVAGVPVLSSLVNTPYVPEALVDRGVAPIKLKGVRVIDRALSRYATTGFHAISETVADDASRSLGIDRSRIWVVPRGRDRAMLGEPSTNRRQRARIRLGIPESTPLLLNVARQEPQKGQRYLLEALPHIHATFPQTILMLAGRQGNSTHLLMTLIEDLELRDRVHVLGIRDDIGDLLSAADVFVFPSLYEGLGGAVLEAMAMGVPIVASDVPALREVLNDGRCGLLVPPRDPLALAKAIREILEEPADGHRRAHAALRRFDEDYSLPRCIAGMEQLYRDIQQHTLSK